MVINHQKNQGYGAGIKTIFLKAKEIGSEVLVTLDADGQHDVNEINKLLKPITDDKSDVVIGSRFLGETENVPSYRKLGINVITKLTNASIKKNLTDSQSGFRAYNKKVIEQVQLSESGMGKTLRLLISPRRFWRLSTARRAQRRSRCPSATDSASSATRCTSPTDGSPRRWKD